ncbi:MAG TPA: hypothetical protein DEB06_03620 [Phycisphaerales bacterium]|nr:hypothetical protein [Phycisphaerales bacterium]
MASKTSGSVGLMITMVIFIALTLTLFVTTMVLFARTQKLTNDLSLKQGELDAAVRSEERDDRWQELQTLAGRGQGVVRYLDTALRQTAEKVTGSRRDNADAVLAAITKAQGDTGLPLLRLLEAREGDIGTLRRQLAGAEEARDAARADLLAGTERVAALEAQHQAAVDRLNAEIETYKTNASGVVSGLDTARADMQSQVERVRGDADSSIAALENEIARLESELLVANDQLKRFRIDQNDQTLRGSFEGALVDGRIIGVNIQNRNVFLDLGRKDRVVLGMTFEVYADGTAIRVDPSSGEYPQGKATIEIVSVDEASSTARIIRESAGTPIIRGDAIANAVYDRNKTYTFTVYGNFDTNADGIATREEAQNIRALIADWNGQVSEDIAGDTDFLVLGVKPALPPQPKPNDPVELIQRYLLLRQAAAKYDELFNTAQATGIPVLNQNRLYTLTGAGARR